MLLIVLASSPTNWVAVGLALGLGIPAIIAALFALIYFAKKSGDFSLKKKKSNQDSNNKDKKQDPSKDEPYDKNENKQKELKQK